ncbi:hypothetical protein N7532_007977 [Penicillium argentinense]|uniref:Retroviral polymerase SH3-like domain-containing protein n=1 Tax=Penicillium argentinense TaxID=1131581 RepID=A0A9W9K161_9EURO|nr:uncharacterized protein N7532_007977 [Penicillium argentinense]KAJ5089293.1 hypothetical protein N7532_007977 [Penicillium argentinense]
MRVLGERTRAILQDSGLPQFLWAEVMRTVVSLRNMLPYHGRHIEGIKSPILGSDAYVVLQQEQIRRNPSRRHLAPRAWMGKLVGYGSYHSSVYRVYWPYKDGRPRGTIHEVRDIIIDEGSDFELFHNPDLPPIESRGATPEGSPNSPETEISEEPDAEDNEIIVLEDPDIQGYSEGQPSRAFDDLISQSPARSHATIF